MTTYNLLQPIAHDLAATRWNDKTDAPIEYGAREALLVIDLHQRHFGYRLQAVPHSAKRPQYISFTDRRKEKA